MAEPLLTPVGGVPELISTPEQLAEMIAELKGGTGPIAIDAERASGYKYSARAYLIQIKRNGGGLHLIDPIPFGPNHKYFQALNDIEKDALGIDAQGKPIYLNDLWPTDEEIDDVVARHVKPEQFKQIYIQMFKLDEHMVKQKPLYDWRPICDDARYRLCSHHDPNRGLL